ncbi:uncharacterized protein [Diadema antillarum]|uniref:uncharacterized protein n=1 Tax=Diadema antillarum TaxID=105358 RepID=UPI003A85E59F
MVLSQKYTLRLIIGCLAVVLGIPGNAAAIAVFRQIGVRNATDVTFIALALVDLVASVVNGSKIVMVFFHNEHPWACFVEVIAARSVLYAGLYLTMSIAVYRYQAVCKPFGSRIGRRAAAWISLVCFVVVFGQHVPFFFITTSRKLGRDYSCNVYGNVAWRRDLYAKTQAAVFCLSAGAITILYGNIYKFIRDHQTIRQKMMKGTISDESKARYQSVDHMSIPSISSHLSTSEVIPCQNVDKKWKRCEIPESVSPSEQSYEPKKSRRDSPSRQLRTSTSTSTSPFVRRQSDHRTTQTLIIITVLFFSLWLPNVIIDQLSFQQINSISSAIPNGSFIIYFLYQIKYLTHITNIFVYVGINKRFRETFKLLFSCAKISKI